MGDIKRERQGGREREREREKERERKREREKERGRESAACPGKQKVRVCSKHAGVL